MRHPYLPEDRGCRGGIGRCDDGSQCDCGRPRHSRKRVRHDRHGCRREPDRDEHQGCHGQPIVLEVAGGRIEGRVEKDGRQEKRQCQLGFESDARCARSEGQYGAANGQQRRVRRADAPGQQRKNHRPDQDADNPFEDNHSAWLRTR